LKAIGGTKLTVIDGGSYKDSHGRFDQWTQDQFEIGFNSAPTSRMYAVFNSPRDGGLEEYPPAELFTADTGVFRIPTAGRDSLDSFGNLEVTPPLTAEGKDWLLGRIYYGGDGGGNRMQPEVRDFLDAQAVQAPVELDSTWLHVGHVDEFISFIPFPGAKNTDKKFKVLIASPKVAIEILQAQLKANKNANVDVLRDTVAKTLARYKADNEKYQKKITGDPAVKGDEGVKGVMKRKFGLEDSDFIDTPVFFWNGVPATGEADARIPDMVNLLVVNEQLIIPRPFYNPFQEDLETKLAAIGYKKSSAANPTIHFVTDYKWYHEHLGEVHCGTNSRREIPATAWWTQK